MRVAAISILALCLFVGAAQRASPRVATARIVALGYDLGDRFVAERDGRSSQDLSIDDHKALASLRRQLEKWNRYNLTDAPETAELLVVIRTGRLASAQLRPMMVPHMQSPGLIVGAEHPSPNDTLAVYESAGGKLGSLLWQEEQRNGLSDPSAPLFQHFRAAVESLLKP